MKKDVIAFYSSSNKLVVKSKNCYLFDIEGKKYIDFESGVWCSNVGHNNKQISRHINKQLKELIHHGYHFRNKFAEQLSVKLQQLIGFDNGASVFLSSGSEAINLSISFVRYLTGKKKILKIDNSYLSAFGFGQISDENQSLVNVKYNDTASIGKIDFTEIAAFVVETGGASVQGVKFPDDEYINKLIKVCTENGCIIIADEITTGMGRLGKWFGFQHYNFIPDIVVTGKGLGNGFPVSAMTVNSGLAHKFEMSPFRYAQSHQNDPFGCSIALEVIKIIEEKNLINRSIAIGKYFIKQLDQIKAKHPDKIKETRARGLMLAIELDESINGELISQQLFENGFVVGHKLNTLRFLPPLTIKKADIDDLISVLNRLLK